MVDTARELRGTATIQRQMVDYVCPSCGMFLTSTDAPDGKRIRVRCTSKGCKGRVREVIVGSEQARKSAA